MNRHVVYIDHWGVGIYRNRKLTKFAHRSRWEAKLRELAWAACVQASLYPGAGTAYLIHP
jgi:hypothetical protein